VADPDALLALAQDAARQAAALLAGADAERLAVATKSTKTDLVTQYDRQAEALIVERLLTARPDDAVLGEEGSARPGTSGVRWVVDPLDGTTNFVYGFPAFAVSIAAEVEGEVVAAVVSDVVRGEQFAASLGGGTHLDGRPVRASDKADLATALVGTGFSYRAEVRGQQAAVLPLVLPHVRDVRRAGSAALDLCWAACGRLDAFWERGLAPWDRAAGMFLAREAGAVVEDVDGTVLAAAPGIHEPFRALLDRAGAFWPADA